MQGGDTTPPLQAACADNKASTIKSCDEVSIPDIVLQALRNFSQQLIPYCMATSPVNDAKPVNVKQKNRHLRLIQLIRIELTMQPDQGTSTIRQTCQPVIV